MREALSLIWTALVGLFRAPASLAAEILVLRHQINILRRYSPKRVDVQRHGPLDLCWAVSIGANGAKRTGDCEAGDRHKMAPRRLQIVLAREVAAPWWPTNCTPRHTQAYPRDGH